MQTEELTVNSGKGNRPEKGSTWDEMEAPAEEGPACLPTQVSPGAALASLLILTKR